MDALSIAADEVALEGLDGVTLPSLWIRLENRKPPFPAALDASTKEFIWASLASNSDLSFYELPEERKDVVLLDRYKYVDPDTGIEYAQGSSEASNEVYPIHIVPENKDGVQGSCQFFKERSDVTKNIRTNSLTASVSLDEALQRYGRKLVVVASQHVRFRALIGAESDPDLKLNDGSYCVLERVGRARWQGELQRDLHVCCFKTDARKFHYLRMSLVKHRLVTMQSRVLRLRSGQQQHSILLLLKRFHINRRSKYDILMEQTSNFLEQRLGQVATLVTVREQLKLNETTSKNVIHHMRAAKLVELVQMPLEDFDPGAGPCNTKRGTKIHVRCMKLLKPYSKKDTIDDEEDKDDEDDEDETRVRRRHVPTQGRIMEKDLLSQAYHIVSSSGARGISQSALGYRMNVGKLEARMLCRKLERDELVKTFMEDEGRQRTTKYISRRCAGLSDRIQQFAKEQERNKLLHSSSPQTPVSSPSTPKTPSNSRAKSKGGPKTPSAKKVQKAAQDRDGDVDGKEVGQLCDDDKEDPGDEGLDGDRDEERQKTKGKGKGKKATVTKADTPTTHPTPAKSESSALNKLSTDADSVVTAEAPAEDGEGGQPTVAHDNQLDRSDAVNANHSLTENSVTVVEDIFQHQVQKEPYSKSSERNHETYRLLRRKNLIAEAVQTLRIIEGLFPLQKMINEEEKQDGSSTKCCRKTILRLVQCLSREGLLKLFTTTVIQDGISKKVEIVVHPSVQPNDDIVRRAIEQVRFRISSSYSVVRQQQAEDNAREKVKELEGNPTKSQKRKTDKRQTDTDDDDDKFKPKMVKGLSRTWGFQPKMHRLRLVHTFLWHVIYGHPLKSTAAHSSSQTATDANESNSDELLGANQNPVPSNPTDSESNEDTNKSTNPATGTAEPQTTDPAVSNVEVTLSADEEEDTCTSTLDCSESMKVYVDDDSWKRFVPPVRVHKDFGPGWAMLRDVLVYLPLSVFIQITQINYKVEELEEYLNDPVKQHYLVRVLPSKMKRQLLYKRKYIFSFYENVQKLAYMGLLQFGPVEKFKEKDQVFLYLRQKITIVNTTSTEPHYWLIAESPEKPFERRRYTLDTAEDVETYWFDLMCVCLNTPLGVIRYKKGEDGTAPPFVRERNVFVGMAYLLKGSREVCDDWSIPGDGKGAAGLHSEFFAHLKRNWWWTSHLLSQRDRLNSGDVNDSKMRLKSLLPKNVLRVALKAGESTSPRYVNTKRPLIIPQNVQVAIEPASRTQQVVGGKRQKRKRSKKEVIKVPRKKKKEARKCYPPAHDEADHRALKMMTKQRVYWSPQEDSLMMLCSVASHLLNSKLQRPYIASCVIRDLLQAEIEISKDKTSLAVRRRTRYILKNPQTLLNYRICLAEVYQDKPLLKLLEEKKPANPDSPEDCAEAFSEYTRLLRHKFSSTGNSCRLIMPDSKHQLFSWFKVCTLDNGTKLSTKDTINCADDIHAIVLNNLIQSTLAMSNYQMKSCRSFQTFQTYGRYDQELLCRVFLLCRKTGLVNRRRVHPVNGPKKNRALPIMPMSYQLSQSYFRRFTWRFPHSLCTDVFRYLRNLINNGADDDQPLTAFYHETAKRAEDEEEGLERGAGSERKEKAREGKKESETAKDETPKEGQSEQSQAGGEEMHVELNNDEAKTHKPLPPEDTSSVNVPSGEEQAEISEPQMDQPVVCPTSSPASQASKEPPSGLMQYSLDSPGGACAASLALMTLGLLSVHVSIPKQMVVVDSSLVNNDFVKSLGTLDEEDEEDDDGEENEGKKIQEVKAHQASHTKYLMMRGYCCPGIVKLRNLNTCDNIVVESCVMKVQLRHTPAHQLFQMDYSLPLNLYECSPSQLPSIFTHSIRTPSSSSSSSSPSRGYSPQDVSARAELMRTLDEAGETGLTFSDLYQALQLREDPQCGLTRSLQQYMEELQESGQVLKVGGLGVRWVLMRHAEPWILTINAKSWSQESLPICENRHKRRRRSRRETEMPPEKKVAVDREGGEDGQGADGVPSKLMQEGGNEQQQLEEQKVKEVEEHGDPLLNSGEEEDKRAQPEEKGEEETEKRVEEEEREQGAKEDRTDTGRDGEGHVPSEGQAGPDEDGNLSFISRPWRLVDGNLNRQVCRGMLEGLLHHIMSRPGLTQRAMLEHYKDVLQPVAVMDLIQALVELGCVTRRTLVKAPKPSLFSRSVGQTGGQTGVRADDPDAVFYEPTISCSLRLALVLPNERHWHTCT
ncbi:general transcription factor 3C polypeptide 1 isoform X2 [Genypterus blacodes]|uniref:general transcription factor 3C polypeptide 1 isoform X2 n=1 Tax=Genypterus blacodes TaxID=154954 RepID=UPI003F75DE27